MHITSRFSLAPVRRSGRASTHSVVVDNGRPTRATVLGTHLIRQFSCDAGFLIVTDYSRPKGEVTTFTLISPQFRVLSARTFGGPLSSWLLSEVRWVASDSFRARFHGSEILLFKIRKWGLPWIFPQLRIVR